MSQLKTRKELEAQIKDLENKLAVYEEMYQAEEISSPAAEYKYGKDQDDKKCILIANSHTDSNVNIVYTT